MPLEDRAQRLDDLGTWQRPEVGALSSPLRSRSTRLQKMSNLSRSEPGAGSSPDTARSSACTRRSSSNRVWNSPHLTSERASATVSVTCSRRCSMNSRLAMNSSTAMLSNAVPSGRPRATLSRDRDRGELPDGALAVNPVVEIGMLRPGVDDPDRATAAGLQRLAVLPQRKQHRKIA